GALHFMLHCRMATLAKQPRALGLVFVARLLQIPVLSPNSLRANRASLAPLVAFRCPRWFMLVPHHDHLGSGLTYVGRQGACPSYYVIDP
ncbi:MAG: hypothetical protein ACXVDA_26605, partial [Ktedonobacterales bacterium]